LIVSIANCGCSRQTSSPSPIKSVRSLDELRKLPVGLKVSNNPNPVYAVRGGRSGMDFTWSFETTVSSLEQDLTIVEFGCYVEHKGNWEFSNVTGKPFTKADFAEWYSCPDA